MNEDILSQRGRGLSSKLTPMCENEPVEEDQLLAYRGLADELCKQVRINKNQVTRLTAVMLGKNSDLVEEAEKPQAHDCLLDLLTEIFMTMENNNNSLRMLTNELAVTTGGIGLIK